MLPCKLLLQSVFITEDAADAIGMEIMDAAELWYMPEIATETMMNTPIELVAIFVLKLDKMRTNYNII